MDGIAKFVGYLVLICMAINWFADKSDDAQPTATQTVVKPDPCKAAATPQLVQRIAPELLAKTKDFGNDIGSTVVSCRYDEAEDQMVVSVRVGWNGPWTGDYYEKSGQLTVKADNWNWQEAGINKNLRDYRLLMGFVGSHEGHRNVLLWQPNAQLPPISALLLLSSHHNDTVHSSGSERDERSLFIVA